MRKKKKKKKEMTYIDMNHNLRLRHSRRNRIADALSRTSPQRRQLCEILRPCTCGLCVDIDVLRPTSLVQLITTLSALSPLLVSISVSKYSTHPCRPQHPMPDLIPQTHNPDLDARIPKFLQRATDIRAQRLRQRLKGCGPRRRNRLLRGVGPVVAEVKVEVDGVAFGGEFLR